MKMTKRIFIALLIVSVLGSAFAFSAFAAASDGVDYDYLLEYYEEPILFDYDFSKDDAQRILDLLLKNGVYPMVHAFYGENENGKSTILAFIKMMFYGSERANPQISKNIRKKYP